LAERALIGAAGHAFAVRAQARRRREDETDLEFARQIARPDELAESATLYAISLVWWAHHDIGSRRDLLHDATELMLAQVTDTASERPFEAGYRIYASQLADVALAPKLHALELDLGRLVSGVGEIDRLTARFADTAVSAVLQSDRASFGDPADSAELMRDQMIQLAFLPRAA
jgi:hypothetical protein